LIYNYLEVLVYFLDRPYFSKKNAEMKVEDIISTAKVVRNSSSKIYREVIFEQTLRFFENEKN